MYYLGQLKDFDSDQKAYRAALADGNILYVIWKTNAGISRRIEQYLRSDLVKGENVPIEQKEIFGIKELTKLLRKEILFSPAWEIYTL